LIDWLSYSNEENTQRELQCQTIASTIALQIPEIYEMPIRVNFDNKDISRANNIIGGCGNIQCKELSEKKKIDQFCWREQDKEWLRSKVSVDTSVTDPTMRFSEMEGFHHTPSPVLNPNKIGEKNMPTLSSEMDISIPYEGMDEMEPIHKTENFEQPSKNKKRTEKIKLLLSTPDKKMKYVLPNEAIAFEEFKNTIKNKVREPDDSFSIQIGTGLHKNKMIENDDNMELILYGESEITLNILRSKTK